VAEAEAEAEAEGVSSPQGRALLKKKWRVPEEVSSPQGASLQAIKAQRQAEQEERLLEAESSSVSSEDSFPAALLPSERGISPSMLLRRGSGEASPADLTLPQRR
jgi:hypothetical protein